MSEHQKWRYIFINKLYAYMWYVQKFLKYSNIFEYSYIQPLVDWQDHRNRLGSLFKGDPNPDLLTDVKNCDIVTFWDAIIMTGLFGKVTFRTFWTLWTLMTLYNFVTLWTFDIVWPFMIFWLFVMLWPFVTSWPSVIFRLFLDPVIFWAIFSYDIVALNTYSMFNCHV